MSKMLAIALGAALAGACAGQSTTGQVLSVAPVQVSSPELIPIGGGLHVLADAAEPVFFTESSYWLYRDGTWYRSGSYRSGWATAEYVPQSLRRVEREPLAYVHYQRNRTQAEAASQTREPIDDRPISQPMDDQQRDRVPSPPQAPEQPYPHPLPPQQEPPVPLDDPGTVEPSPAQPGPATDL